MVILKEITMENFLDVINLKLSDEDKQMVASNMFSLAEAYADKVSIPRAIYYEDQLVGFIMYDYNQLEQRGYISRLMVSTHMQGKGIGTMALNAVVEKLRKYPDIKTIQISYHPDNEKARKSYKKAGFIETNEYVNEEIIALIKL